MDYSALIPYFIEQGRLWVLGQRDAHRAVGVELIPEARRRFLPFFAVEVLDAARFVTVPRIENPPFFGALAAAGISAPIDFTQMAGITFIDTVLISRALVGDEITAGLLFHELVHVVQYQLLGLEKFMEKYVTGWAANSFDYFQIPLERIAFDLQVRFEANPSEVFPVLGEVRARI